MSKDHGGQELTEHGQLVGDLYTACHLKSDAAVSLARQALAEFHARNGTRGRPMPTYAPRGRARTVRLSTSTPAARASSGGSILADLLALRGEVAALRRGAIQAQLAARRQRAAAPVASVVGITDDGDFLMYDEDAVDDLDFEVVTTEEEARRQARSLIG